MWTVGERTAVRKAVSRVKLPIELYLRCGRPCRIWYVTFLHRGQEIVMVYI